MEKVDTNHKILFLGLILFLIIIIPAGTLSVFAEKIVSVQKIIGVDKLSLIDTLSHLEVYSQILPNYIQSSKLISNDVGNLKIGLDWISIDTNIKFIESDENVILEVISGDFKGTKLYITMIEKSNVDDTKHETDVLAKLYLQRSWHMELLTSFVSDSDVESMLHTSLNGLEKYAQNSPPQPYEKVTKEKEPFCIFSLCF